jgi:hypothetical protein
LRYYAFFSPPPIFVSTRILAPIETANNDTPKHRQTLVFPVSTGYKTKDHERIADAKQPYISVVFNHVGG